MYHSTRPAYMLVWLTAVCLLLACGGREKASIGTLRISNGSEVQSLDPHRSTGQPGIRVIGALFEGLVVRGLTSNEVRPGLARSWEISPDGLTYTFHLRPSLWSDSLPVTAQDFAASWRRLASPATGAEYASLLGVLRNADQVLAGEWPPDSLGVHAADDSTLVAELTRPTGYFLQLCAFEPLYPVPQRAIAAHGDGWTSPAHIVGNGPYRLEVWRPNDVLILRRNPAYWDAAQVRQTEILVYPIEYSETAYKMFRNGELDWIYTIPLSRITSARRLPEYMNSPQYGVYYYSLNLSRPEFADRNFRRALSLAIDRERIVKFVTRGGEHAATGLVPLEGTIPYPGAGLSLFQPDSAREYLRRSEYGRGKPLPVLQIYYNTSEAHKLIAEVVAQMWQEVLGVRAELLNNEWKIYLQSVKEKKYSVARSSWIADYPDPYSFLELGMSTNGNNRTAYQSPAFDRCLEESQQLREPAGRFAKMAVCERILLEDMPLIPIYFYCQNEMRSPRLRNAFPNAMGLYSWKDVYLE